MHLWFTEIVSGDLLLSENTLGGDRCRTVSPSSGVADIEPYWESPQRAAQTRQWQHSQVLQGQSIAGYQ